MVENKQRGILCSKESLSGIVGHIDYGFVELFWICYSVNTTKVFFIFYGERGREFGDIVRGGRET